MPDDDVLAPGDVGGVEILAVTKLGRIMPLEIKTSAQKVKHSPGDVKDKLTAIHVLAQGVKGTA